MARAHNFSPGPAVLPLTALELARDELIDFEGSGISPMELSHRGKEFESIHQETKNLIAELMDLPPEYKTLFLQGGASLQFAMIPMNFLWGGRGADFIITGTWSKKALKEARLFGDARVVASTEASKFDHIPDFADLKFNADAAYVHLTSNNTIYGAQYRSFPNTGDIPIVADMSSDILSKPFDVRPFGLIYAGAQKNLGPAGLTLVIIREDMLQRANPNLPSMLRYQVHVDEDSRYNTPPTWGVYMLRNVLRWVKAEGGLSAMEKRNKVKATLLYDTIDGSGGFYRGHVRKDSRSLMNVPFRLPTEELEAEFLALAKKENLVQLKGHRSVGGIRASIYNALELKSVEALCDFMKRFASAKG
jgi:phosphoserine aminotransferase